MSRSNQALILLTLMVMGVWGCAEGAQSPGASLADRVKALEAKNAKLEDDFRAVAATRDQLRRKLAAAEDEQARLQKQVEEQVQAANRERDELRNQLAERTRERDVMVKQFEQFRKGLKDLLGRAEAALPRVSEPISSATPAGDEDPELAIADCR
jgi:predicted RNase H-like nuclease (RuvC/YqgF family)